MKRQFIGELGASIDGAYRSLLDMTGALTGNEKLRGRLIVAKDYVKTSQDIAYGDTTTVAPSISWDISDSTTLDMNLFHTERRYSYSNGVGLTVDGQLPDIPKSTFIGAAWNDDNYAKMDFAVAILTQKLGENWLLNVTIGQGHFRSAPVASGR